MILRRHNRCRGIRLWKWNTFQIEVWFCPNDELIEPHFHARIDSRIYLLFGRMTGNIENVRGIVKLWKGYPVKAGAVHSATMSTFCVFANVERWVGPGEVTSAADDFTAA